MSAIRLGQRCFFVLLLMHCGPQVIAYSSGAHAEQDTVLHVDCQGDDNNPGTVSQPLASLLAARDHVRRLRGAGMDGNIEVTIHGGTYYLEKPLEFLEEDSAPPGSTTRYRGERGSEVVISGGVHLKGWEAQEDQLIYASTEIQYLPGTPLRQLFGRDQTYHRARMPNDDYFRVLAAGPDQRTSFQVNPGSLPAEANIVGAEVAMLHDWSMSRVTIAKWDGEWVFLDHRIGAPHDFFRIDGFEPNPRFFLEGSAEFLDDRREFVQDASATRVLMLKSNGLPDDIVLPRLSQLIRIVGTETRPVRGLVFEGLQFRHTHADIPRTGYAGIQASFFENRQANGAPSIGVDAAAESGHSRLAPAINCEYCADCQFVDCQWGQLGGGALYLDRACHDITIQHCSFDDIGGCGIMIGETLTRPPGPRDSTCSDNRVQFSKVQRCGQLVYGSVGIWIGIARNTNISGNELSHLPYSGISVGWRWDDQPSGCRDNQIIENHIHHVMQTLSDGGGIYTLGRQPGTVLRGNRIHDVPQNVGRAESNGIFMDEGSSEIEVSENEISRIARSPIRFHRAGKIQVRSNRLEVAPGVEPFTFNATDPGVIEFQDNHFR